ncbi:MAG: glutamate racemase [Bacteroidia bacterium]|nr:glutamate racemase [Bacteroidia bacterium]MBP9689831.1 glutamate racemase [Bacteroidia bacterium]
MIKPGPIGVFDSGYGGLTVLKEFEETFPQYDFLYLGDNARAPYGTRSFETVYEYTLSCVKHLINSGCRLIILACNTASAKALRTIQQKYLPVHHPDVRVLGVIRPTAEVIGQYTNTQHVGVFATNGTVISQSYVVEINKFYPAIAVYQEACPMWVPLVENNEHLSAGADYFVQKHINNLLQQQPKIDTFLLGCTHYPLLMEKIKQFSPSHIKILTQAKIVSDSLADYLNRHPEIEQYCSKTGKVQYLTTDDTTNFNNQAASFLGKKVFSEQVTLIG